MRHLGRGGDRDRDGDGDGDGDGHTLRKTSNNYTMIRYSLRNFIFNEFNESVATFLQSIAFLFIAISETDNIIPRWHTHPTVQCHWCVWCRWQSEAHVWESIREPVGPGTEMEIWEGDGDGDGDGEGDEGWGWWE